MSAVESPRPPEEPPVDAVPDRVGGGPSRPFILRPIATSLLMVAIVLAGLVGLRLLPLSALPQVDYPTIQVQTLYPGASPDVMAQTVTAPLERQFGQMSGLSRMSAVSSAGASMVTLQFDLTLNLDVAEQEVQAAINAANALLPADLPAPPVYAKVNPADAPILTLAVTSDALPLTDVQNLVNTNLAQKIQIRGDSRLKFVDQVEVPPGGKLPLGIKGLALFGLIQSQSKFAFRRLDRRIQRHGSDKVGLAPSARLGPPVKPAGGG